jgi:hypothetical protein
MRLVLGPPPDDPSFQPAARPGWRRVREMGPRALMAVGTVMGIPLAVLVGFLWSRIPLPPLSLGAGPAGPGTWSVALLPVVMMAAGPRSLAPWSWPTSSSIFWRSRDLA